MLFSPKNFFLKLFAVKKKKMYLHISVDIIKPMFLIERKLICIIFFIFLILVFLGIRGKTSFLVCSIRNLANYTVSYLRLISLS